MAIMLSSLNHSTNIKYELLMYMMFVRKGCLRGIMDRMRVENKNMAHFRVQFHPKLVDTTLITLVLTEER